jgi:hypothetical protein
MFLMDYSGSLLTCGSEAEISLHPPEYIASMIAQYEASPEFWGTAWDEPEKLIAALRSVDNSLYRPSRSLVRSSEMLVHPEVEMVLERSHFLEGS